MQRHGRGLRQFVADQEKLLVQVQVLSAIKCIGWCEKLEPDSNKSVNIHQRFPHDENGLSLLMPRAQSMFLLNKILTYTTLFQQKNTKKIRRPSNFAPFINKINIVFKA